MIKEFFVKRELKKMGVSGEQLDAMMKVVKGNPGLFQRLGQEIEEQAGLPAQAGKNKLNYEESALAVTTKYRAELAKIFGQN